MDTAAPVATSTRPSASHIWMHGDPDEQDDSAAEAELSWLLNAEGFPVEVPTHAVGYRVRFIAPGSRGMGEPQLDDDTGRPLLVDPHAGPAVFFAAVGYEVGRYRLLAVDRRLRPIETAEVAIVVITERMVQRARSGSMAATPATPAAAVAAVAAVAEANRITERVLSMLEESMRAHRDHASLGISAAAEMVRAAGDAGLVKRGSALARSPFSAAELPTTNDLVPISGPPSVPRNSNAPALAPSVAAASPAVPAAVPSDTAAEAAGRTAQIVDRFFDAMAPMVTAVAPAVGFKAGKWAGMPDAFAGTMAQVAGDGVRAFLGADDTTATPTTPTTAAPVSPPITETPAAPPRSGAALVAHAMVIQSQLEPAAQAWVGDLVARHPHVIAELSDLVASMTVGEGVAAVGGFRAVHAGLTDVERRRFDDVIRGPNGMRTLFRWIGERTTEEAINEIRSAVEAKRPGVSG